MLVFTRILFGKDFVIMEDNLLAKVHSFESFGAVDGPGIRYIIFMQGCHLQCKYCQNRDTWNVNEGTLYSVSDLMKKILKYKNTELEIVKEILKSNKINDTIYEVKSKNFDEQNIYLSLENTFCSKKIKYHYKEYLEHLNSTKELITYNKNYKLKISKNHEFKNIQILICENNWVMLSKANNPSIHFIIHYSKLRDSIQDFFTKND